jgi:hypothetical protein
MQMNYNVISSSKGSSNNLWKIRGVQLFFIKNEVLNFATPEDSGHKVRIPSAYNFEYVIYKWTYFPVWGLKFAINEPTKERVTDVNTIVKPSKPREEIKETEQD